MTGADHYTRAVELVDQASDDRWAGLARELLAEAQVHATLALVTATMRDYLPNETVTALVVAILEEHKDTR